MTIKVPPMIEQLVELGVDVTIRHNPEKNRFEFDLNTGAKSPMIAHSKDSVSLTLEKRYEERLVVHCFYDLTEAFESCIGPTKNYNPQWGTAMRKYGAWGPNYEP